MPAITKRRPQDVYGGGQKKEDREKQKPESKNADKTQNARRDSESHERHNRIVH
jgi:hypothetical protein